MLYQLIADLLLILHLLFVVFALFGGLLVLWRRWWVYVHLPAACWGVLVEFNQWICPLTPLEQSLRSAANQGQYSGGFIEHYIMPVLYPKWLTIEAQIVLGSVVIVVNLVVYGFILWRLKRSRQGESSP